MKTTWYIYCLPHSSTYRQYYIATTFPAPHGGWLADYKDTKAEAQEALEKFVRAKTFIDWGP